MSTRNLFMVASPLQFLNAIEAKKTFQTNGNILVLMLNSNDNILDANQKMQLLNEKDWDEVIIYDLGKIIKYKRIFQQVKLIKSLKKYNYNYIFSGEFGVMNQALLASLISKEIYLLDDGTATIFLYDKINDNYLSKLPFYKKARYLRYKLFGLKYKINNNINFFTIYNIQSTKNIKVIKHSFSYLKSHNLNNCKKNNFIYILGQNIVETNYINENTYIKYIKSIISYYNNKKIIYIPHRSESTKKLNSLISDNFILQPSSGPIEMKFISESIYPAVVISFFSSSLFSLEKIFHESLIQSIKINYDNVISRKEVLLKCYEFLDQTNVSNLKID